jgi:hypothetical protein
MEIEDRFWKHVDASDVGGCWLWTGETSRGYGRMWFGNRRIGAHRVSWELANKQAVPEGMVIDHLCCNPTCVRPDHLEAVTNRMNVDRGVGSPATRNREKTHCVRGHEFTPENTAYERDGGKRVCKTCRRAKDREAYLAGKRYQPSPRGRLYRARGAEANKSGLTEADVLAIRASAEPRAVLAQRFGVSSAAIGYIVRRRTWGHV